MGLNKRNGFYCQNVPQVSGLEPRTLVWVHITTTLERTLVPISNEDVGSLISELIVYVYKAAARLNPG